MENDDIVWEDDDANDDCDETGNLSFEIKANDDSNNINKAKIKSGGASVTKRCKFDTNDYDRAFDRHVSSITTILSNATAMVETIFDRRVKENSSMNEFVNAAPHQKNVKQSISNCISLGQWFVGQFKIIPNNCLTIEEGRDGSDSHDLTENVLKNNAGCANQIIQLLLSLLLRLGYHCRLIVLIDPISYSPFLHDDLRQQSISRYLASSSHQEIHANFTESKKYSQNNDKPLSCWLEVLLPMEDLDAGKVEIMDLTGDEDDNMVIIDDINDKSNLSKVYYTNHVATRWVHFDIINDLIDQPHLVEEILRKRKSVEYAIAITPNETNGIFCNDFCDVTKKYSCLYNHIPTRLKKIKYMANEWLESYIMSLNEMNEEIVGNKNMKNNSITKRKRNANNDDITNDLSSKSTSNIPLPTSFTNFKNHPVYVLQRHLLSDEMIHPINGKIVGIFKGESVYLQAHKENLKTKTQWRRQLLKVKE
eukprot:gene17531-24304_t